MSERKLSSKVAAITGGARGLGRGYALRLAGLGADIAIIDRNLHAAEVYEFDRATMTAATVMAECEAKGVRALGIEADPTGRTAATNAIDDTVRQLGRLDIVVCNAGGGTVRGMLGERSDIGEVGEQQHGRAAEMRLERTEKAVGKHEDALPDGDAGLAGKASVYLSHDAGELLVAHERRADGALVVVERVVEAAHVAAGDAEDHVDAGFLEHSDDRLGGACLRIQQLAAHGLVSSRYGCVFDGIEPFACSLGRVTMHYKPRDTSLGRRPSRG
jgi:hypothetical protein